MSLLSDLHPAEISREIGSYFLRPFHLIRRYRREDLRPDLTAGLSVAVVLLPASIAYAQVAELPPQAGMYAAIVASIIGGLWGSSSHLQSGPTNPASLLVLSSLVVLFDPQSPEYIAAAGLMAVMVGVARLLFGVARLGVLVNFVSDSVIIGFTAGAGILIAFNQVRHLLRLDLPSSPHLLTTIGSILNHIRETHLPSLGVGLLMIAIVLLVKRFKKGWPWALIAITTGSIISALQPDLGLAVLGEIPRTLPPLADLPLTDIQLIGKLSTASLALAAIGLVEATSIARSIAAKSGERIDSNQEFVGQGLANIASGLFSGYPTSGSFIRSAVNFQSGGKSSFSNVFAGLWTLLGLLVFAPLVRYVPKAGLAGVLVVTAVGLIDAGEIKRIWRATRGDSLIMLATFLATLLLPLEFAILSGMIVSFARYIISTSTPEVYPVVPDENFQHMVVQQSELPCLQLGVITIGGSLYFGATQYVEDHILAYLDENPEQRFLLLRMSQVDHLDVSGVHMLEAVVRKFRERGGDVYFTDVRAAVRERMRTIGFDHLIGDAHYLSSDDAIPHLFYRVLDPHVCIYECDRRVFAECQALPKHTFLDGQEYTAAIQEHDVPHWLPSQLRISLESPQLAGNPLVVDVREQSEYERGHIPQTRLLPLRRIRAEGPALPHDRPIVLVCRSGRRSRLAAGILQDLGYTNVYNMKGGMLAWEAAGYPVAVE